MVNFVSIKLSLLYFFKSCFQLALNNNQYKHLQALAFALHLAEARNIGDEMVNKIDELLKYFNKVFQQLYTVSIRLMKRAHYVNSNVQFF